MKSKELGARNTELEIRRVRLFTKDKKVTSGGGLGDAAVPQRGFGGECPQGFS